MITTLAIKSINQARSQKFTAGWGGEGGLTSSPHH